MSQIDNQSEYVKGLEKEKKALEKQIQELLSLLKVMKEALEVIAEEKILGCTGAGHNRYCNCAEETARFALSNYKTVMEKV